MSAGKTPSKRTRPAGAGHSPRKTGVKPTLDVTVGTVAARLLALPQPAGSTLALWRKADLGRHLSRTEKTHLDAALAGLLAQRRLVAFDHGEGVLFAWAEPLREWLGTVPVPMAEAVGPGAVDLMDVYRRLVRESGGFPDVKISSLARALGPLAASGLAERLTALWLTGDVTLSLGDWSLANEETRAAAVQMDGEHYLLLRFETT